MLADEKIHLFAVFRSHDIFKSGISNAFGLLGLQQYISEQTGLPRGKLSIMSNAAHIYEEDWAMAEEIVQSKWHDHIQPRFDELMDIDPRGIVIIRLDGSAIIATLRSPDGKELYTEKGTRAKEIILQLAKRNLLSQPDHYADIAIELVKAEIAAKLNIPYVQDKPLRVQGCLV